MTNDSTAGFVATRDFREVARRCVEAAILAPSSHNTQPWLFRITDSEIDVYADETRWLKVADASKRELFISIGCAIENLVISAGHHGYRTEVRYFPNPENETLAATVAFEHTDGQTDDLFEAIPLRHTNHKEYRPNPIVPEDRMRLENSFQEEGVGLYLTDDADIKRRVEELVVLADSLQFSDPEFREELGYWIGEGVFGAPWLIAKISQFAVTHLNLGNSTARKDTEVLMSSPLLGIICSETDDRTTQVRTGRAFERVYLKATLMGLSLQPMSQIVEIPKIRDEISKLVPVPGAIAQQPFRLGFADPETKRTPRRPIDEVLM